MQRSEKKTQDLQKQLASRDAEVEGLQSGVQQLFDDVRLNQLEEKFEQTHNTAEITKRRMETQQDEVDVQLESLGSRLRQFKDDINNINSDTIAKVVVETDQKGSSVRKMRVRLEELEGQVRDVIQMLNNTSARVNELKFDVAGCKNTFAFINRATQAHTGQKGNSSESGKP